MTVSTQISKVIVNGNGVATSFSFSPVAIFDAADLEVTFVDALGLETLLTEGTGPTNYAVVVASYPGTGSITYPASGVDLLATGEKLVINRVLDLVQELELDNQGGYFPKNQEVQFDKTIMIAQQLEEGISRAVLVPIGSTTAPADYLAEIAADVVAAEAASAAATAALAAATAVVSAAVTSATQAAAAAAEAEAAVVAAEAIASNALWSDVVYLTSADSPYTVTDAGGKFFSCNATGGAIVLNAPSIAVLNLAAPWAVGIKKTDVSANTVSFTPNGTDKIDGSTDSLVLTSRNQGATLIPDTDPVPDEWTSQMVGASTADYLVNRYSGDSVTVAFTLSAAPGNENNTDVYINGIYQQKNTYAVVGATLTFDTAPPTGLNNVEIVTGVSVSVGTPGANTVGANEINGADAAAIRAELGLGALAVLSTVAAAQIDARAVTIAKMAAIATGKLLGRSTAAAGDIEVITPGSGLTLAGGVLTSASLSNSSVGQAQLKTSYNEAALLVGGGDNTLSFVSAGGEYSFAPVWKTTGLNPPTDGTRAKPSFDYCTTDGDVFATFMTLDITTANAPGGVGTIRMRYISASPPYDLGDGQAGGFIFLRLAKGSGKVDAVWASEDPPWAYNGPTRTRANRFVGASGKVYDSVFDAMASGEKVVPVIDRRKTKETLLEARIGGRVSAYLNDLKNGALHYEPVTMATKMKDIAVVPHPFHSLDRATHLVAMIDPLLPVTDRLIHLMRHADEAGESVADLVFQGDVTVDNVDLVASRRRKAPPGVMLLRATVR